MGINAPAFKNPFERIKMKWLWYPIEWLVLKPLRLFYHHGPVWRGASLSDACAQMTTVPASFWDTQPDTCQERFDREFQSFSIAVGVTGYFCILMVILCYSLCQCCFVRPILSALRQKNLKQKQHKARDVLAIDPIHCCHHCVRHSSDGHQARADV